MGLDQTRQQSSFIADSITPITDSDRLMVAHVGFWLSSVLGTSIAGGVFGIAVVLTEFYGEASIIELIIAGFIFGFFSAGIAALPVHVSVVFGAWDLVRGYRPAVAGLAGTATGVLTVFFMSDGMPHIFGHSVYDMALAGLLGGGGAFFWTVIFTRGTASGRHLQARSRHTRMQFSLKSAFIQTTLVAFVILMWIALYKMFFVW